MLLKEYLKDLKSQIVRPFVKKFCNKLNPNIVTKAGLCLGITAGILFIFGEFIYAVVLMVFSGVFDLLDGELARECKKSTEFGKFLDSTCDRIVDFAMILGITWHITVADTSLWLFNNFVLSNNLIWLLGTSAIFFSFLVSYIRALGERGKINATLGLADRGGRFFLIFIFALMEIFVAEGLIIYGVLFVTILSLHTVWQRYSFISKKLKQNSG